MTNFAVLEVASLEFTSKEYNEDLDYKMKLKSIQSKFIESIPEKISSRFSQV